MSAVGTRSISMVSGATRWRGRPRGEIDLFDAQIVWQARTVFRGLEAGRHEVEIRVLGRHRSDSNGDFVDVDAFAGR
jgi:hypothetical protein